MTRMSKTLGLIAFAACLAACSHKYSGERTPGPEPLQPPTGKPVGQFTGTAGDHTVVNQTMYCSYGQGDSKYVIDSRLKVGMKFETQESWLAIEGSYSGRGHIFNEILLADNANSQLKRRITFADKLEWWYSDYCTADNVETTRIRCETGEYSPQLQTMIAQSQAMTKKAKNFSSKVAPSEEQGTTHSAYCWVTPNGTSPMEDNKYEIGTYTLKSGKQVPAFRKVETWKGDYDCGDGVKGTGVQIEEKIVSKDVPNPDYSCDQATELFHYRTVKSDDGKVLMEEQSELFDF